MADDMRVGSRAPDPSDTTDDDVRGDDPGADVAAEARGDRVGAADGASRNAAATHGDETTADASTDAGTAEDADGARTTRRAPRRRTAEAPAGDDGEARRGSPRAVLPLVPVLAVLLVLLLAGTGFLWLTRPASSSVRTADYVDVLQAARAGVVDVTSFDYLTLDDDIAQIEAVTTGDLTEETVDRLEESRQSLVDSQGVVTTEVVGAGVGAADDATATVFLVIRSTQTNAAVPGGRVQTFRIEVDLMKEGDRWLLSGISGR